MQHADYEIMTELEKQLRKSIGTMGFVLLMKLLKRIEISFDGEDRTVTVYRNGQEPVVFTFSIIEDFINNVH